MRTSPMTISWNVSRVPEPSSRVITVIGASSPPTSRQLRNVPA